MALTLSRIMGPLARRRASLRIVATLAALVGLLPTVAATQGGSASLTVVRGRDGSAEVRVQRPGAASRIVGFGFERHDVVQAFERDVDGDGDGDIVVTNASAGSSDVAASGRPTSFTIVTPAEGLPALLDVSDEAGTGTSGSNLGDRDNFGYGPPGPAPCVYFDNREQEDLGVFDYEESGDQDKVWTHTFNVLGEPSKVQLTVPEIFSDHEASSIDLDGHTLNFAYGELAVCDAYPKNGFTRVFVLTGSDAFVAADGTITVTFNENGDDIALNGSKLRVRFT